MPVLTFSREYPAYHPKVGQQTFFVEKILNDVGIEFWSPQYLQRLFILNTLNIAKGKLTYHDIESFYNGLNSQINSKKVHTIRALRKDGKLWKPGDMFSPRVWSGKSYNSPQVTIAPDIEVKKVWDFEIKPSGKLASYFINGRQIINGPEFTNLCRNDGLENDDLEDWFRYKAAKCQIICWNENINY